MTSAQHLAGPYRRYLAAVVLFHLAAADQVGLSGTDYQASNVLALDGPMTSGELARRLALSSGATTRLMDRMVAAGYARRIADPADRRRVLVEHTGYVPERLSEILDTVSEPVAKVLQELTPDQLDGLGRYIEGAAEAYHDATTALSQDRPDQRT
jgi:DNA-binding MarR family transcriptional regulator